jgi:diguanylate cyclase (GGDEF)-like protein
VYVLKGSGVESNPWLEHPDLEAADGSMLTLRNPALITREISEIVALQDDYRFRITSLKPLNPGNTPDDFERRAQEANKAIRTGTPLACAIIDADDFKALNDRHGHPVGYVALKTIAQAMKETIRAYDTPSRYGGEEFLILFPGLDGNGATVVCDRLRQAITGNTAAALPEGRAVTVSIGLADLATATSEPDSAAVQASGQGTGKRPDVPAVIEVMLKHADAALYKAKASGKNCCVVYAD